MDIKTNIIPCVISGFQWQCKNDLFRITRKQQNGTTYKKFREMCCTHTGKNNVTTLQLRLMSWISLERNPPSLDQVTRSRWTKPQKHASYWIFSMSTKHVDSHKKMYNLSHPMREAASIVCRLYITCYIVQFFHLRNYKCARSEEPYFLFHPHIRTQCHEPRNQLFLCRLITHVSG